MVHALSRPGRPGQAFLFPALLALAFLIPVTPRQSPAQGSGGESGQADPLRVVLATPQGPQQELYSIDVTFSEPMIRLGDRGKRSGRGPIEFEPKLKGSFTWLGTRTVSFLPDPPPPAGTRILCTLPAGTKSITGRKLEETHTWTILFRPARLVVSIPETPRQWPPRDDEPQGGGHPPSDPVLLAFDRPPVQEAARGVRLEGPDGSISLHPIPVESRFLEALNGRDRTVDSLNILALRPDSLLTPGSVYRLVITPELEFQDSPVGLADTVSIPFRILGPPGILLVEAEPDGLQFTLASSVDPDTLLAHLRLDPDPGRLEANGWSWSGGERINIRGDFPPGKQVKVEVSAGLTDRFGRSTIRPFRAAVRMPHAPARLEVEPGDGVILPGPEEFLRLKAQNTGPVRIRWAWVDSDEVPLLEAAEGRSDLRRASQQRFRNGLEPVPGQKNSMPWEARWQNEPAWLAPESNPDSLCRWERLLTEFGPRPREAQVLLLEATAVRSIRSSRSWGQDTLFTSTTLQPASLGISSRRGAEHGLVWVTDLKTGKPVPEAEVTLWDLPGNSSRGVKAGVPLWRGFTDTDGLCWFPGSSVLEQKGSVRLVRAQSEGRTIWLRFRYEEIGPTPMDPGRPNAAFLLTDRPIYRPGETVQWKGIVRHSDRTGLKAASWNGLEAILSGPRGTELKVPIQGTPQGNPHGRIEIPETAPTGRYSLRLAYPEDPSRNDLSWYEQSRRTLPGTWVQIEAFRAPRFEARVDTDTPLILSGGTAEVTGRFAYFSGPPLSRQPVVWRTLRQDSPWSPPGWDKFHFREDIAGQHWSRRGEQDLSPAQSGQARLDEQGRIDLQLPIVLPPEAGDSRITVEIGARDMADQSAFDRTSIRVVRGPYRPGVHTVSEEVERRKQASWEWVVVDTAGVPLEGLTVNLELVRREWKTVRILRVGGTFDYENSIQDSVLSTFAEVSTLEPRALTTPIPGPGYHFLRIRIQQPDGSVLSAAAGRYFGGDDIASMPRITSEWLTLETDREKGEPGDTIQVIFPVPPGGAEGLVLLESGGIVRARRMHLRGTPSVAVPLEDVAPPDATIAVILAGPDRVPVALLDGPRPFLPYFAYGERRVEIERDGWRARVEVAPERATVGPGEEVFIEVRLSSPQGEPLSGEVALAVVDEAVLALAEEQTTDPLATLFRPRSRGTIYDDTRYSLQLSPMREKGDESPGGGGMADAAGGISGARADFRPTAYWNPAVQVGQDGLVRVPVRLPDTLTRYRIRATATCAGEFHGVGDAELRVDQPLVVEPAAPRFVRLGDEWILGAVVENHTSQEQEVLLRCQVEGAELRGDDHRKIKLQGGETGRADFKIRSDQVGTVRFRLEAAAAGQSFDDRVAGSIICSDPTQTIPEITFGRAAPVAEEVLSLEDETLQEAGTLKVEIAPSLLSRLSGPIEYLLEYPHPCLEQISSRMLALQALKDLSGRMPPGGPDPARADSLLRSDLRLAQARLRPDGFALWPGSDNSSAYLDGYVLYTLARVRAGGVEIPDPLYNGAGRIVRRHLDAADRPVDTVDPDTRAFLTYTLVLARPGLPAGMEDPPRPVDDVELERLDAVREQMSAAGRLCQLLALAEHTRQNPGSKAATSKRLEFLFDQVAQGLDRSARTASLDAEECPWPWASRPDHRVQTTALAAIFLARSMPNHPLLPSTVNWLLDHRTRGHWPNTHENAWALEAVRAYVAGAERLDLPLQGRLILGLTSTRGFRFTRDDLRPVEMEYTLEELSKFRRPDPESAELPLKIESAGQSALFYEMRLERTVRALQSPPMEEGLIVFREYVDPGSGRPLDRLERGQPVLAHLAVMVPWDSEYLVLEDPLPAGLEVLNLRLRTTSRLAQTDGFRDDSGSQVRLPVVYQDLRDDRVILYADQVRAGVYHLYYPVAATTAGTYRVPGARGELMYSPEIFGTSGVMDVEVK